MAPSTTRLAALCGTLLLGAVACGGTEPPPPPAAEASFPLDLAGGKLCEAVLPAPSDLFFDENLEPLTPACGAQGTLDAVVTAAERGGGAALDARVLVPGIGPGLSAASLTSTQTLNLAETSTRAGGVPPYVLLEQIGTATRSSGWAVVSSTAAIKGTSIEVRPGRPLARARRHVLILTDQVRDANGGRARQSDAVKALLGSTPISTTSIPDLGAEFVGSVEAERQKLAGLVQMLGRLRPPIPASRIVAAVGFTTQLGLSRLDRTQAQLEALFRAGTSPVSLQPAGGDLDPDTIDARWIEVKRANNGACPLAFEVSGCYDRVRAFRRGVIKVPRFLDANGRLKTDWARSTETVDVPFLASLPKTMAAEVPLTLLIVGHGRGRIDAREIANEHAARLGSIVLAIELAGIGERSVDPTTGQPTLDDLTPNGGNPELTGPDSIPDRSGESFFPGTPLGLRDAQLAAAMEVLSVLAGARAKTPFAGQGLPVDGRQVTVIAQGVTAQIGLYVAGTVNLRTLILPSGGAGLRELVLGAPNAVKQAFITRGPPGLDAAGLDAYLTRLESRVLQGCSTEEAIQRTAQRLVRNTGNAPRVLIPYASSVASVSEAARTRLSTGLALGSERLSRHRGLCEDFFLFTCRAGDNFAWVSGARAQFATFSSSNGVTVLAPAP